MATDSPAPMRVIREPIELAVLSELASRQFGDLVKAVVDVEQGIMVIGGELHANEEAYLLDLGSKQGSLWVSISTTPSTASRTGLSSTP